MRRLRFAALFLMAWAILAGADKPAMLRSLQVELPGQEQNAIKTSWPGIGCWFWSEEEFKPEGWKRFLDLHAKHSACQFLTTSIRHPVEVTDPEVHDRIKAAAEYARGLGLEIVMDLDVRLARGAFERRHPGEMQEIVRWREVALGGPGEAALTVEPINLGDHYTYRARGYDSIAARVLRVYSYVAGPQGIARGSVEDITDRARVEQADAKGVRVSIPANDGDSGRTACVLAAFTLFTPDVFAPHLIEFERNILRQYADVPLAGACKDEWGFPGRHDLSLDGLYFSRPMAEAYARRRPGRDLARDLLLMVKGEAGRQSERAAAINHYMDLYWRRNAEVENAFYDSIKQVFGPTAMSGTHPTWYPYPDRREVFKNGLSWWACRRDLAQTDEGTPYAARTALAKKWHSPLWYNMYYERSVKSYEEDLWRHALGGGRMNFHPLWPHPTQTLTTSLLSGPLLAADARVRLLNTISTAPIDCPAAVVFGHPAALNWAHAGFADMGMAVADRLWEEGYYADLIPTSEISEGHLVLAPDGRVQYGPQRYAAVILVQPQYERPAMAEFFRAAAAAGKTALFRVGEWTMDFEGNVFAGHDALPAVMAPADAAAVADRAIERMKTAGIEPQTRCAPRSTGDFPVSMMPLPSGRCRLLDGTVILASGEKNVMGDPIRTAIAVNGRDMAFDAVGVAAARLDKEGHLEALAAGGLKSFRGGGLTIELPERLDLALWRGREGGWRGVLHGWTGPIPAELMTITHDWLRTAAPQPLSQ
jgi:hypothetical protein